MSLSLNSNSFPAVFRGEGVPAASVFLEGGWFPPEQEDLQSSIIEVDPEADQVGHQASADRACVHVKD